MVIKVGRAARMIFPGRFIGYFLLSIGGMILYADNEVSSHAIWFALFTTFFWPLSMVAISQVLSETQDKKIQTFTLKYIDPIFMIIWIIISKFSIWYIIFGLVCLGVGTCSIMGYVACIPGFIIICSSSLWGIQIYGVQHLFKHNMVLAAFSILTIVMYCFFVGFFQYRGAVKERRMKKTMEILSEDLIRINTLTELAVNALSIKDLFNGVATKFNTWFGFEHASLLLFDRDEQFLKFYMDTTKDSDKINYMLPRRMAEIEPSLLFSAVEQKNAIVVNQYKENIADYTLDFDYFSQYDAASVMLIPLSASEKNIGVICFFSKKETVCDDIFLDKISKFLLGLGTAIENRIILDEVKARLNEIENKNHILKTKSIIVSKYLSPQVYKSIFEGNVIGYIGSTRKRLTFVISKLDEFDHVLDELDSDLITKFVNQYLSDMTRIIIQYGGTIDQYLGVQIRFFLGDPVSAGVKKDALLALVIADEMKKAFDAFKKAWPKKIVDTLSVKMAICSEYTDVGNFGSQHRMNYTVIGDIVSTNLRLLNTAQNNEILITEDTYLLTKPYIHVTPCTPIIIQDQTRVIHVYRLEQVDTQEILLV